MDKDDRLRILVAEDDPLSRALLEKTLSSWGYEIVSTCDGVEAWNALQMENAPLLAILDWMMPGMDGIDVCRKVRERKNTRYTYILLVTAKDQKENITEAVEAGADDYITKPFHAHELQARLGAGRRILDLQAALLHAQEELRVQATHDTLTGLWNRGVILEELELEIGRCRRDGTSLGVVLADLDHFKRINDTYGHLTGDVVLREIAHRIQQSVREYDRIGRYGGEEVLIVLPGCDAAAAFNMAERIRKKIEDSRMNTSEATISITLSLGVATNSGYSKASATALIRGADLALYRAKKVGGNRVELASASDFALKLDDRA